MGNPLWTYEFHPLGIKNLLESTVKPFEIRTLTSRTDSTSEPRRGLPAGAGRAGARRSDAPAWGAGRPDPGPSE